MVLSPLAAALVLRIRLMAPSVLPDPALHTAYIVDPHDVFTRYAAALAPTARLREGARVGFLVPARLDYLAFGAVPGFFVTRYLFALVAVGPIYLLLRRLYGPPAGVVGILVVLSSTVILTAWGTDYADCAVVSYAAGGLACLAMPCAPRWRRAWLAAAGVLLVMAVWSHGVAVPLVGATLVGYLAVRLLRDRARLAGDLALLAGVAVAVTGLLLVASAVLLGHANFIGLTWQALRYLSQPSQTTHWHSANWRWAPYVAYLLVPPAVLGAFAVAVARRGRAVPTPVLLVGVVAAVQLLVYSLLQFVGTVQTLEQHYLSSTLWSGVCLASAITIAELARPLSGRPFARWLPVAVLLAVPLGYEADPHVPSFGWIPFGAILAAGVIVAAVPALIFLFVAQHIYLFRKAGAAGPATADPIHPNLRTETFYPKQLVMDMGFALLIIVALGFFAWKLPTALGPAADPSDTVFLPRPESYHIPVFQYLKYWAPSTAVIGILVIPTILGCVYWSASHSSIAASNAARGSAQSAWRVFTAIFLALGFFGFQSHHQDSRDPGVADAAPKTKAARRRIHETAVPARGSSRRRSRRAQSTPPSPKAKTFSRKAAMPATAKPASAEASAPASSE